MSLPLAARGPVSAALGRDEPNYRIFGLHARNPAQRLDVAFSSTGVTVATGEAHLHIALLAYGRVSSLRRVRSVLPQVHANNVAYAHAGLREWYANGPLGLEQGFDVASAPKTGRGPLTLSLALSGNLRARLGRFGVLLESAGVSLRYGGLDVSDARGRTLHSWLQLTPGGVQIRVDDRGALYPLRIDPFVQRAELTTSDGAAFDELGRAVAVSGDTIVAGARSRQVGANVNQGAVYVFTMPASGWANATQTAELTASDGATFDELGFAVAISGDTIVAGAHGHKVGANEHQGAVYVFTMPAGGWRNATQNAELTASDGATNDELGWSVGVWGSTVVAGAPFRQVAGNEERGAAYAFAMPASGWANATQSAELTASDGAALDELGFAVAISGNTVIAGAPFHQVAGNEERGAAYAFAMPASGWANATQSAELTASNGTTDDRLGYAVAISGNTVVAGAPRHGVGASKDQGAAYVFTMPASGWTNATQTAELTASDGATNDELGFTVAISGNTVVAGMLEQTVGANARLGAVYVFTMPASGWTYATQSAEFTPSDGAALDEVGLSVAVSGSTIVVGAPGHQVGAHPAQGATYAFVNPPPTIGVGSPADGASYTQGRPIAAAYSCTASAPASLTACAGPVSGGALIDTSTLGKHSFAVNASDSDSTTTSQTVVYTVVATPVILPPSITAARQTHSIWREGSELAGISSRNKRSKQKPPIGTAFSFTLNEQAAVTFQFTQHVTGRTVKGKCVAQAKKNHHNPACRGTVTAGRLSFTGHGGTNKVLFQGSVSRSKHLKPGRYTLTITATNSAGQKSAAQKLNFTIVR